MPSRVIHFAGGLRYKGRGKTVVTMLAGWAACCSGDRAYKINADGNWTRDRKATTCKACLKLLRNSLPS